MKKYYLTLFALLLPLAVWAEAKKPNIVLFLVDDMGWQDTSVPFHSERTPFNDHFRTPNMERLARQGVKFTQAYAATVCSPTRTSIMTGQNPIRHHVTNWTFIGNYLSSRASTVTELVLSVPLRQFCICTSRCVE